jgi:hypothetical protein
VTYEQVKAQRVRRGRCTVCGLRMIKQRTFMQTVSPFNKHSDGEPKTWHEVRDWHPEFKHEACGTEEE